MSGNHANAKGDDSLYEMLLNAIPSSVLLVGRDLRITLANRNFLERSRRTREETLDRRLPEVFPPAILDHTEIVRRIQSVFDTNKPTTGERIIYRAPGGLMRIYYYRVLPLSDRDNVEFAILVMEDVTERERLSEDIRRMERHLRTVVESTSEIILSTDTEGRILSWNQSAEQISGYTPAGSGREALLGVLRPGASGRRAPVVFRTESGENPATAGMEFGHEKRQRGSCFLVLFAHDGRSGWKPSALWRLGAT